MYYASINKKYGAIIITLKTPSTSDGGFMPDMQITRAVQERLHLLQD